MNIPLLLVIAVTVGAVVFGVMTLVTGGDPGLRPVDPDSRARPLPGDRPLVEADVSRASFDVTWRGYRMGQVDQTLRRLAYDIGYKSELIQVLEAEIIALREGRLEDADTLADARAASLDPGLRHPEVSGAEPEMIELDEKPDENEEAPVEEPAAAADEPESETDEALAETPASPKTGVA